MEPNNHKQNNADQNQPKKGVAYMTTIQKWGNSLAVRIPSDLAKSYGVEHGSQVELEGTNGGIFVRPIVKKPTLDDLLAKTEGKTNPHLDYNLGKPEGREYL